MMDGLTPTTKKQQCHAPLDTARVLYIAEQSPWGERGYRIVSKAFSSTFPVFWSPARPKPDLSHWQGDWIISFKSDLVLPPFILQKAKIGAINFHPSSPKYRGIGGYWWALHNGDTEFGVTCHHMTERIDYGDILQSVTFPILPRETPEELRNRTAVKALDLLSQVIQRIQKGDPLNCCGQCWSQHLYTYKELEHAQSLTHALGKLSTLYGSFQENEARQSLDQNTGSI